MSHLHHALPSPLEQKFRNSANQRFHYDGHHIVGFDGRVLDVDGESKAEGAKLIYYDRKPGQAPNQTWDYKDGHFHTRMGTGFVIDVSGGAPNVKDGGELILWKNNGGENQKWDVDAHGYIRSRVNNAFVIDVNGGAVPGKGLTKVSVWTGALNHGDSQQLTRLSQCSNQRWHYDGNHIVGFDGRVLDVDGESKAEGAKLIVYDRKPGQAPNQTWDFKDGHFYTRMGTGFVIDVSGGAPNVKNGGELILWKHNGGANQKWDIDSNGFIRSRVNAAFTIDVNGGPKPAKGLGKVQVWQAAM